MNIDEMQAGYEMDLLIETRVFGPDPSKRCSPDPDIIVRPRSTDLAAAWEIVEKLNERKRWWFILEQFGAKGGNNWNALFWDDEDASYYNNAVAHTVPLAICRAALKAVENW